MKTRDERLKDIEDQIGYKQAEISDIEDALYNARTHVESLEEGLKASNRELDVLKARKQYGLDQRHSSL